MADAEQLASLTARRGLSESPTMREAIADVPFSNEFVLAMTALREMGYGQEEQAALASADDEDEQAAQDSKE